MELTPKRKFERWVREPLKLLRSLPDGDGAFAALGICCGLYERFIDSMLHYRQVEATPAAFRKAAADDLGCTEDAVDRFWNGYRLGMQHAFQPKAYVQGKGAGDKWGWEMAEAEGFHLYPEIVTKDQGSFVVRIDPWKFVKHVVARWEEHFEMINQLSKFVLGNVSPVEQQTLAGTYDLSPQISEPVETIYKGPRPMIGGTSSQSESVESEKFLYAESSHYRSYSDAPVDKWWENRPSHEKGEQA